MKLLTKFYLSIHFLWVTCFMWGAPHFIYLFFEGCQSTQYFMGWLLLLIAQFVHWKLLKRECILSLLEKKSEDPTYVMGSNPAKSHMWKVFDKLTFHCWNEDKWKTFHYEFTKMNVMMCIGFISLGNSCFKEHKLLKTILFVVCFYKMNMYLDEQRNGKPKQV